MANKPSPLMNSFITWSIQNHPDKVELSPVLVIDTARKNDKRPAKVELFVDDDWVKNWKGNQKLVDSYPLIRVDGAVSKLYEERKKEELKDGSD